MTRVRRLEGTGRRVDPSASHLVRMLKPLITFSGCVLVVACLYWGQAILIPIALAVLITFLLGPLVSALRRLACLRLRPCSASSVSARVIRSSGKQYGLVMESEQGPVSMARRRLRSVATIPF